ncbi:hypothetical protein [Paenibacillus crassostreae]|uniref:Uncharacterized protein n=1 Tax=Paenibacillus crassostreae TaxID=1763538 RepID=A0A167EK35_9BACL|nr:hypothetical protein [Paenibacillus crassostreae]AOZ94939.1 hypothetical protein LPB68_22020 [Paenibacillus crassostreae]OAB75621.1 hypothetical protein PNBC_08310 [Paenibacillus crassostreae]
MLHASIQQLESSPMFQLSLSSKELFHSNLLSWLFANYKSDCSRLLRPYIGDNENQFSLIKVNREEKNRDLTLYFKNESGQIKKLTIENKVKSIPNYAQLEAYSTDAQEYYLLLSLSKPHFFHGPNLVIKGCEWRCMNYAELACLISEIIPLVFEQNLYHGKILEDYVTFIRILQEISSAGNQDNELYDLYQDHSQLEILRKLRLDDFYIKQKHAQITSEFTYQIRNRLPNLLLVPEKKWDEGKLNEVFSGSGFTRGTGISEVKYVVKIHRNSPVILGIQVQGEQFRLFVETKEQAREVAEQLYKSGVWFNLDEAKKIPGFGSIEYPLKDKRFNGFGDTFMYRSVKVEACRLSDLVQLVVSYISIIESQKDRILVILDEVLMGK